LKSAPIREKGNGQQKDHPAKTCPRLFAGQQFDCLSGRSNFHKPENSEQSKKENDRVQQVSAIIFLNFFLFHSMTVKR
jgi:hypothetical protein